MKSATLTFPDGTTATLADQPPGRRYVDLIDHVAGAAGDYKAGGTVDAARLTLALRDYRLGPANQAVADRVAALPPGSVVRVAVANDAAPDVGPDTGIDPDDGPAHDFGPVM